MSLDSGSLRGFMKKMDLTVAREQKKVTETYRKIVAAIFVDIVEHTPQFTGNLAYGWEIVFGPHSSSHPQLVSAEDRHSIYRAAGRGDLEPYERGDEPAVDWVLQRELPKLESLRWNSKVRIVNMVEYAEDVDAGNAPPGKQIRPENLYYGKVFMTSYAAIKYGRLKNLVKVVDT